MNLDDLLRQPWFYKSPSPFSLLYYGVLVFLGARILLRRVEYRRWRWSNALTESFFLNGFIILSCDVLWMWASAARFLPDYPDSLGQVLAVLGRNVAGMAFCYMVISDRIKQDVISFKESTFGAYFFFIVFLTLLFTYAQTPAFTDWTFAVRMGASTQTILTSLIFSYGLGKAVGATLIWTWWKS